MSKRSRGHRRRTMIEWFPLKEYRDALVRVSHGAEMGRPDPYAQIELERQRRAAGK